MREQQFLRSPQPAAAQPLAPSPNRSGIPINWGETAAMPVEIRRHRAEMAANVCCINVEPGCRQGHDAHLALEAQAEKVSAAMQARRAT